MSRSLILITALLLSKPALGNIVRGTVSGVVDGVAEGVVDIVSSQCQNVKKILGVNYNQSDEPDMSELQLDYYANDTVVKYNLTEMEQILNSGFFNSSGGVIIYMHGFTDNPSKTSFQTLNNAFHERGIFNILALDASDYIGYFYLRASTMVVYIGETLGEGLTTLMEKGGLDISKVHLIGHSLGSHIASYTAKTVYNMTGSKVGRVTGLDPAGPCFSKLNSSHRLNKTDALFVDVIHTDAGVYGLDENCGYPLADSYSTHGRKWGGDMCILNPSPHGSQVDYYPNNGSNQPGCVLDICSHSRAWEYFAESVTNTTGFPAVKCDSWKTFSNGICVNNSQRYLTFLPNGPCGLVTVDTSSWVQFLLGTIMNMINTVICTVLGHFLCSYMGYASEPGTTGEYYLRTNSESPYALGTEGI